ncbi:MAG: hypothetical protein NVS9B1_13210 [Candidatus Dormibacteraceae bacterium]
MEDPLSFEMVAASIRADAADSRLFLEVLAAKLAGALPGATRVEHDGGLWGGKHVKRLHVELVDHHYELARTGTGLAASRSHTVRGITLKTESLALEQWIEALARHLADHAQTSARDHAALSRLIQP